VDAGHAPYDAREVGNFVLTLARRSGRRLTQMSLLKIIFYSHGWYLAENNIPLVKQQIEAWEHGPVIKVVRDAFRQFGNKEITKLAEKLDLETGELVPVGSRLSPSDEDFIESIYMLYESKSAYELSNMTHERGGPWDKVWNTKEAVGRFGLRIRNEDIRNYFREMKTHGTLH
jgi:uncharacterized phage-associated protein